MAKTAKGESLLWQIAKQRARSVYSRSIPISLSEDGQSVLMFGLIHGNVWAYRLADLVALTNRDKRPSKAVLLARATMRAAQ